MMMNKNAAVDTWGELRLLDMIFQHLGSLGQILCVHARKADHDQMHERWVERHDQFLLLGSLVDHEHHPYVPSWRLFYSLPAVDFPRFRGDEALRRSVSLSAASSQGLSRNRWATASVDRTDDEPHHLWQSTPYSVLYPTGHHST